MFGCFREATWRISARKRSRTWVSSSLGHGSTLRATVRQQHPMIGFVDDPHTSRAQPVENPIVAEQQAGSLAGADAGRLKLGEQAVLDEQVEQFFALRLLTDAFLDRDGERVPVLAQHQRPVDQIFQQQPGRPSLLCRQSVGRGRCACVFANICGGSHDCSPPATVGGFGCSPEPRGDTCCNYTSFGCGRDSRALRAVLRTAAKR